MLVVGDKEQEDGTIAVRQRGEGDKGVMTQDDFIAVCLKDIAAKTIW